MKARRFFSFIIALGMSMLCAMAQPGGGIPFGGGNPFEGKTPEQIAEMFRKMNEPPSDPSYEMKELSVVSAGNMLYGQAFIPQSSGRHPAIIFSHGFGSSHTAFYGLIRELAKEGFVCVCYDFAGGSRSSKSEGRTQDMSIFSESQNLKDVLDEVRSWSSVDKKNIFLLGESQGGCVSAITAPDVSKKINSIILGFPALCIPDDGFKQYPTLADIPQEMDFMGMRLGRAYYDKFYGEWEIYKAISKYKGEVLIVHGTNDSLVKPEYSAKAANAYKHCELHLIFGAGHGFNGDEQTPLYLGYIRDFIARNKK